MRFRIRDDADMVVDYVKRLRAAGRGQDEEAERIAGERGYANAAEMEAGENQREREMASFHDVAAAGRDADGARADLLADAQARLNDPNASEYEKQAARAVLRFRQRDGRDGVTAQGTEGNGVRFSVRDRDKKKSPQEEPQDLTTTIVSSRSDGTKVRISFDKAKENLKNLSLAYKGTKRTRGFLADLSQSLGDVEANKESHYFDFQTKDGKLVSIRTSNHNINGENIDPNAAIISIVVKSRRTPNSYFDGDGDIKEFVYFKERIKDADGDVLSQIAEGITELLETGRYEDKTGIAVVNQSLKSKGYDLLHELHRRGLTNFTISESKAHGHSVYVEDLETGTKFRLSDHGVTSNARVKNEIHVTANDNVSELADIAEQRQRAYDERVKSFDQQKAKVDELRTYWDGIQDRFAGDTFVSMSRTYQDLNTIRSKHPEARDIRQVDLGGGAYSYEWHEPSKANSVPSKPSIEYMDWYRTKDGGISFRVRRAPNGEESRLDERQYDEVRTGNFKRWFGDWELGALYKMATDVWGGDKTQRRFNFAPSERAAVRFKELLGHDVTKLVITSDAIRHIKKHHGNDESRGQISMTAEDIVLLPYLIGNYDTMSLAPEYNDKLGNRAIEIRKRVNGTTVIATIERGKANEHIVTSWKFKKSDALDAQSTPGLHVRNDSDFAKIKQEIETIKESAKNSSKIVDANGEPLVVWHGTDNDFFTFDRGRLGENTDFNADEIVGQSAHIGFWFNRGGEEMLDMTYSKRIPVYLDIKEPVEFTSLRALSDEIAMRGGAERFVDDMRDAGHDGVVVKGMRQDSRGVVVQKIKDY